MIRRLISRGTPARMAAPWLAVFAACLIGLPAAPASAQSVRGADGWMIASYGNGCSVILFDYYLSSAGSGRARSDYSLAVEGGCDANGLASGPLRIDQSWSVISDFDGQLYSFRFVTTANAANGLLQGYSEETAYEKDPATGRWEIADQGDVRNPMPTQFRNGCPYFIGSDGNPDFSADMNDWQGCSESGGTAGLAQWSSRAGKPAPAGGSSSATPPATFTTIGGARVGPAPAFAAGQEKALATVADGLLAVLGGREGLSYATGESSIETVIASLRTTLGLDANAALGGKAELLAFVIAEVRKALAGANPAATNGQVADLVVGTVRQAIATANKPPPAPLQAGGKLVSAADVQSVIDYLGGKGHQFARETTVQGTPALHETSDLYDVFFLGCDTNNEQCVTVQFRACYSTFPNASLGKANGWNRLYSYAKSYLDDEGNVCVEQTVPTGRGGISAEALDVAFDAFVWLRENMGGQFN